MFVVAHISFVRCLMKTKFLFITKCLKCSQSIKNCSTKETILLFFLTRFNALLECLMKQHGALT